MALSLRPFALLATLLANLIGASSAFATMSGGSPAIMGLGQGDRMYQREFVDLVPSGDLFVGTVRRGPVQMIALASDHLPIDHVILRWRLDSDGQIDLLVSSPLPGAVPVKRFNIYLKTPNLGVRGFNSVNSAEVAVEHLHIQAAIHGDVLDLLAVSASTLDLRLLVVETEETEASRIGKIAFTTPISVSNWDRALFACLVPLLLLALSHFWARHLLNLKSGEG